ncbi:MAG TPA: hypothetical protein VLC53_04105 [Myxococcota bacterium]|nr:hypothetical protein [Myxococcota bacterium]
MRLSARLAPLVLDQVLPEGGTRRVPLGSFWETERAAAPGAIVLVFLRHFG